MINLLKYSSVPVFISFIILYLCCLIPVNRVPDIDLGWGIPIDKIGHFLMYFGLSGATALNYIHIKRGRIDMKKLIVGAFLLPIIYGGIIELMQNYIFYPRSGDWFDFLADILGSLAALPFALSFKSYLIKNRFR